MSAVDAVDGSSTRHVSAMDVGAVKAPMIQRSYDANDHDNRSHGLNGHSRLVCVRNG